MLVGMAGLGDRVAVLLSVVGTAALAVLAALAALAVSA
jgi:hypothetical protein